MVLVHCLIHAMPSGELMPGCSRLPNPATSPASWCLAHSALRLFCLPFPIPLGIPCVQCPHGARENPNVLDCSKNTNSWSLRAALGIRYLPSPCFCRDVLSWTLNKVFAKQKVCATCLLKCFLNF